MQSHYSSLQSVYYSKSLELLMTPQTRGKFQSIMHILTSQGINFWDARMQARKILGIRVPELSRTSKPSHSVAWNEYDRNSPDMYPTVEDRLDVYFHSIVATCRSVVFGTVTPKSWSAYAGAWQEFDGTRNHGRYSLIPKQERVYIPRPVKTKEVKKPKGYWKMVSILEANGLTYDDARMKASSLLGGN